MIEPVLDTCGCCSGTGAETPIAIENAPGLSAISYRVGRHADFKSSILAALSGRDVPALAGLGTRADDDVTIALADGFAVMADILTFYQERFANEAFLRTATERRSVLELARLLGYQLAPGVAADVWLAFTLDEARMAPVSPPLPVTVPERTKVQSVPGPNEAPQTFETIAPIEARIERNAMAVQTRTPQAAFADRPDLFLEGTGHQLTPGDTILIVGRERLDDPTSKRWRIRTVRAVEPDDDRAITRITWLQELGSTGSEPEPPVAEVGVHAFRQRAAVFGHNAPHPWLLSENGTSLSKLADLLTGDWNDFELGGTTIDLDQAYPKIVPGGWLALVSDATAGGELSTAVVPTQPPPTQPPPTQRPPTKPPPTLPPPTAPPAIVLYGVETVAFPSATAFGLSARVTRVGLDADDDLASFGRRETLVLAQTEELPLAERPVRSPVFGDLIALATIVPGLAQGQPLAVSGVRQHLRIAESTNELTLRLEDETTVILAPGDRVALLDAPTKDDGSGGREPLGPDELMAAIDDDDQTPLEWLLEDRDGRVGTLEAGAHVVELDPPRKDDPPYAEIVHLADTADAVEDDRDRTHLHLGAALVRAYDRESVRINANVAPATHGETVGEILGSGDAATRDQRMPLKQTPLTYVAADTPSGRRSTVQVRVDGTLWTELPSLFGAAARDRVHAVRTADDGTASVAFGDGIEGARLPTGQANIRADYRKGLGAAGNVQAGQLTTLLTRPLGVTAATNPEAAAGGEDPEAIDAARQNAPLTVLTLDRAVSRRDYEDFARGFAGIAKAHAAWIARGPARGIFVTVAGPGGAAIDDGGITHARLVEALRAYGDPLLPVTVHTYRPATFRFSASVTAAADQELTRVLDEVRTTLLGAFAFDVRDFGQPVSIDEVVAVVHRVSGVVAVDVDVLRRNDQPTASEVRTRLDAALPTVTGAVVSPAELLTIDPAALVVGGMP